MDEKFAKEGVENKAFQKDAAEINKVVDDGVFYISSSQNIHPTRKMDSDIQVQSDKLLEINSSNGLPLTKPTSDKSKSFVESLKDREYRVRFFKSLFVSFGFWVLGFQIGQRGPSFLDIQLITGTNVEKASTFFTAGSVGYLSGSLISGIIYDKLNKTLLLSVNLTFLAITVAVIPLCTPYGLMLFMFWANSSFMGWLDTGGNAYLMSIWGEKEGRPYVQAGHFAFAFGGVISPLVTKPFLTPTDGDSSVNSSTTYVTESTTISLSDLNTTTESNNLTHNLTTINDPVETQLIYAYIISGILTFLSALPFIVVYCRSHARRRRGAAKKEDEKTPKRDLPLVYYVVTMVILDLMYLTYCCVEDTFSAYLLTFVVLQLKWSKSKGSIITAVYWASFAVMRFTGIFFIGCVRPTVMIMMCMVLMVLSYLGMFLCSNYHIEPGVWFFSIFVGMSMSVIFPTGLSWAHENLFTLTGKVTSSILIASSTGTMINPIILGYLMQELSPMWYCYLLVGQSIVCFLIFLFLLYFSKYVLKKVRIVDTVEIDIPVEQAEPITKDTSLNDDHEHDGKL